MKFTLMVCDDQQIYRNEIIKAIKQIVADYPIQPEIVQAADGFGVLKFLETNTIDVLFMDIEMIHLDGINTAKEIRKKDNNMIIVFITAHESFALQSYDVQAFDYILKNKLEQLPRKYDRLMKVLVERFKMKQETILVGNKVDAKKIVVQDIFYIEVDGHGTKFYLDDDVIFHNEKISAVEKAMASKGFIRCHNSFIVNLDKIEGANQSDTISYFEMENGEMIEISRRRKKESIDAFFSFIRRR